MTAKPREDGAIPSDPSCGPAQVIAFRPRTSDHPPHPQSEPLADDSVAPNRNAPQTADGDDFRQRMLVNVAAFVFLAGLTGAGIWLAASISDLRRTQDCVLANRPNCAQITVPPR